MLSCLNGIVAKALKLGMGVALWTTSEIVKVLIASNIQTTSSNIAKMFVWLNGYFLNISSSSILEFIDSLSFENVTFRSGIFYNKSA